MRDELGIAQDSGAELGNCQYEYYVPIGSVNVLFLMEMWVSNASQIIHRRTDHYKNNTKLAVTTQLRIRPGVS